MVTVKIIIFWCFQTCEVDACISLFALMTSSDFVSFAKFFEPAHQNRLPSSKLSQKVNTQFSNLIAMASDRKK